jgi:replicative DNA helicase
LMTTAIADPLPKNLDAERAVLGAILLDNLKALEVYPLLAETRFSHPAHRLIYRHMQILSVKQQPIELVTLVESLESASDLESVGGAPFVASLMDGRPKVSNVAHYARIVLDKARSRDLIHLAANLQANAFSQQSGPAKLAEEAISHLLQISSDHSECVKPRTWSEIGKSAVDELVHAKMHPEDAARFRFRLRDLDEMTAGAKRKELWYLVAPTSNGKSLLAWMLAASASEDGFKTLYFSAEMPAEQLAMREIAYRAGVKFYFTQRPQKMSLEELGRLKDAAGEHMNVTVVDADVSPLRIWAMAEAVKRSDGLDLVVIDYDQLVIEAGINPDADDDNVFRHQRAFVFAAKRLAERLDICVVVVGQLRKVPTAVSKGAHPRLDDIWGDSSVRNTPHQILWLVRDFFVNDMNPEYERRAHVYVLKARNGRTGVVELDFDPERVRFLDKSE